jgi:hypothetical protein
VWVKFDIFVEVFIFVLFILYFFVLLLGALWGYGLMAPPMGYWACIGGRKYDLRNGVVLMYLPEELKVGVKTPFPFTTTYTHYSLEQYDYSC